MMLKTRIIYIILLWACLAWSFYPGLRPETKPLKVSVKPVFHDAPLRLREQLYLSSSGDSLYVDVFRFYISGVKLLYKNRVVYSEAESYHLIDAEDSTSQGFNLHIPSCEFDAIRFSVGVDSLANVSGAMGGDLDPVKGMYWAWNTGYINAKLEGRSPSCKTLHRAFEFHIGGYLAPYKTCRDVTIELAHETNGTIAIEADAAAWLNNIELKTLNNVVMPSQPALRIADNYKAMFRPISTHHINH